MLEDIAKVVGLGFAGWVAVTLHQLTITVRAVQVTLVGGNGDNGINSRVKRHAIELGRMDDHLARHDVQLAMLRGRE